MTNTKKNMAQNN